MPRSAAGRTALTRYHRRMFDDASLANMPKHPDVIALDGSKIRLLTSTVEGSSMVHALLHLGTTTHAVHHLTVEEVWFCIRGKGELWRKDVAGESVIKLAIGVSCAIPLGTSFQFRATVEFPLELVITATPPWSGDHEAVRIEGKWGHLFSLLKHSYTFSEQILHIHILTLAAGNYPGRKLDQLKVLENVQAKNHARYDRRAHQRPCYRRCGLRTRSSRRNLWHRPRNPRLCHEYSA